MTRTKTNPPQLALLVRIRHDLRTLLNAIIGYSEMLLADAEDERNEEWASVLERMLEAGRNVFEIVNQKLDPTRDESGHTQFDPKILGEQLQQELQAPLEFIICESDTLVQSAMDRNRDDICNDLKKINVAAWSFYSKISTLGELAELQTVAVGARDEPFAAGPNSAAPELRGNILVVDDNETNRDVLSRHLARQGHTVRLAENGWQALEIIEAEAKKLDLVLLDVVMPEMSGLQVLQHLKGDATLRHIPVIMISVIDEPDIVAQCIQMGADDYLPNPFDPILLKARIGACQEKKRLRDREARYLARIEKEKSHSEKLLNIVIPIGIALSTEKDFSRLLEKILLETKSLCNADGGTLYLRTGQDTLEFIIASTDSLNLTLGGATGQDMPFPPLPLYDITTGKPNQRHIATSVALNGQPINIPDAYQAEGLNFTGPREFDELTNYHTKSCLTIPLKNSANHVIGVIQLLNAQNPETGEIIPFDQYIQQLIESLALLAAVALEVYIREQNLRRQIELLRIEIDEAQQSRQVAEITESDYFYRLKAEAEGMRRKLEKPKQKPGKPRTTHLV